MNRSSIVYLMVLFVSFSVFIPLKVNAAGTISGNLLSDKAAFTSDGLEQQCNDLNLLYETDGTVHTITGTQSGFNSAVLEIPSGVTHIGENAFAGNMYLEEVRLPETVTEIKENAFRECSKLKTIDLGGTEQIYGGAFYKCILLEEIQSIKLTEIYGESAFAYCENLSYISFPQLTSLGAMAFSNCRSLISVGLPNLKQIEKNTFDSCTSITALGYGCLSSVTFVDEQAFRGCSNLQSIELPSLKMVNQNAFFNCSSLYQFIIPPGVNFDRNVFSDFPITDLIILHEDLTIDHGKLWLTERDRLAAAGLDITLLTKASIMFHGMIKEVSNLVIQKIAAQAYTETFADYMTWEHDFFWDYCFTGQSEKFISVGGESDTPTAYTYQYNNVIHFLNIYLNTMPEDNTMMKGLFDHLLLVLSEKTDELPKSIADLECF